MTTGKLLIIDAAAVFSEALQLAPYMAGKNIFKIEGIVKNNFLVSRYSVIKRWAKTTEASAVLVLIDKHNINSILEPHSSAIQKPDLQVAAFKQYVVASGFSTLDVNGGSTIDCINQLITHSKSSSNDVCIVGDDILLTRYIDARTAIFLAHSTHPITEAVYRSRVNISPAQTLDFIRLVGVEWYKHLMRGAPPPTKTHIKNVGAQTAAALLTKHTSISKIFESIGEIPSKIATSLAPLEKDLLEDSDTALLQRLHPASALMPFDGPIKDHIPTGMSPVDYDALATIYKSFALNANAEQMKIAGLQEVEGIGRQTAVRKIRGAELTDQPEYFDIPEQFKNKAVVYRIINTENGRMYFGSTSEPQKRLKKHIDDLRLSCHHNPGLNADYKIHGRGAFKARILRTFDSMDKALLMEQVYIDMFYGRSCCYNYNRLASESAPWSPNKTSYTICAKSFTLKQRQHARSPILISGQGYWLSIHAASKDFKRSKAFLVECFKKAAESGGEFQLDGWRYILGTVPNKHAAK